MSTVHRRQLAAFRDHLANIHRVKAQLETMLDQPGVEEMESVYYDLLESFILTVVEIADGAGVMTDRVVGAAMESLGEVDDARGGDGLMPTYSYRRSDGVLIEILQSIGDPTLEKCPTTGLPVERVIKGRVSLDFRGTGFYETDYKRKGGTGDGKG